MLSNLISSITSLCLRPQTISEKVCPEVHVGADLYQILNWDLTHYILIKGLLSLNTFLPYIFNEIRRLNRSKRKELWRTTFSSAFTRQKRQLRLFRNWKHLWWKQLFFRRRSRNCALSVIKNVVLGRSLWIRQYGRKKGLVRRCGLADEFIASEYQKPQI